MLSFLFEQYGYYPNNLVDRTFFVGEWEFRLIEAEYDEADIRKINDYCEFVKNNFFGNGPYIIKTRQNKELSLYDNKNYVLVSVKRTTVEFKDINKFHVIFKDDSVSLNLSVLLEAWKKRIEDIEVNAINSLRVDSVYYSNNLKISVFCLGMATNAMQYLSDLISDYGKEIKGVTITHKRISGFNGFDFFNPFNYVFDHPVRDYVELYRNDIVDIGDLIDIFKFYDMDSKLASLFIARLLYPVKVLDLLEAQIENKDKNFNLKYSIEKEMLKIKKAYIYFREKYNIRPIDWLEL